MIIDLIEHLDKFMDRGVPFTVVVWYYVVFLPYMTKLLIPVASLLASLFTVGRLASTNEITAMRAAGQSAVAFIVPFLVLTMVISLGQVWFSGWVVPRANSAKLALEREAMKAGRDSQLNNLRFRDHATRNVSIASYSEQHRTAYTVVVEEFGSVQQPRLQWKLEAPSMTWDDSRGWVADSARRRTFSASGAHVTWEYNVNVPFSIRHDQISQLQLTIDELTFDEVWDYIATLRAGGRDTRRQEIDFYAAWAFPFANLVVVLIAVPFASVRRKAGIAVNIAMALAFTFSYIAFSEIAKAVGTSLPVSAVIVGWFSNAVFFVFGLVMLFRLRR